MIITYKDNCNGIKLKSKRLEICQPLIAVMRIVLALATARTTWTAFTLTVTTCHHMLATHKTITKRTLEHLSYLANPLALATSMHERPLLYVAIPVTASNCLCRNLATFGSQTPTTQGFNVQIRYRQSH